MGRTYDGIDERLGTFLAAQHVFFVATAPDSGGHVNVSPKGYDGTFAVLDPHTVAYLDLTGSGVETLAHLRQNGRVTLMFCAFEGPPRIVRLYGRGRAVLPGEAEWDGLVQRFSSHPGRRSVVVIDLDRVADSCGYAVPFLDFRSERDVLDRSHETKGEEALVDYRAERNAASIDGLPGLPGVS